jgi:hypothetical protein
MLPALQLKDQEKLDQKPNLSSICKCHSCGFTFSKGRGLCADWFCSARCREWYDNGGTTYKSPSKEPWKAVAGGRVVAGPPDIEVGSVYYNKNGGIEGTQNDFRKPSPNITLEQVAACLDLPSKAVKKHFLEGKNGKVVVRADGRNFYLVLDISKRQLSAFKTKLSFMYEEDGKFFLYRLPTANEAKAIRSAIGVKKKPAISPEILARLKNNLPTPLETPRSCGI